MHNLFAYFCFIYVTSFLSILVVGDSNAYSYKISPFQWLYLISRVSCTLKRGWLNWLGYLTVGMLQYRFLQQETAHWKSKDLWFWFFVIFAHFKVRNNFNLNWGYVEISTFLSAVYTHLMSAVTVKLAW